ncbi:MAG: ABC transporter ATP-binding protein [Candidatus Omnitrophota bacterium]
MNTILQIDSLTKAFPGQSSPALDRIDLSIKDPGEIVCISGPNGSGKTTFLKCLAGLVTPTSGKIRIFGLDQDRHSYELKKRIGMSTDQERSFYWRLTGKENLKFFAGLHGIGGKEAEKRIHGLAETFEVTSWIDMPFSRYSTGIRQRFSLLRALIHEPSLLLLDEPHRSLDENAKSGLWDLLRRLSSRNGTTVIFTTPGADIAGMDGIKHKLLKNGRIVS